MSTLLYGKKNYRGKCIKIAKNKSDMKDTELNYRSSSLQLTSDSDKALFYTETGYHGDVIYRTGRKHISDLRDPDVGGMPKFNNEIKSVRLTPFRIKVKYHFIWIDGDLPGEHEGLLGLLTLAKQIKDMHEIVNEIWKKYFIDLEMDEIIGQHNKPDYFILENNELSDLKKDPDIGIASNCINIVFVEGISSAIGIACKGNLTTPVGVVTVRPVDRLFTNARTTAHEIGHILGLGHGNNSNSKRLMTQTGSVEGDIEDAVNLEIDEVERLHRKLARNDANLDVLKRLLRTE